MCRLVMNNHLLDYLALENLNTADCMIKGRRVEVLGLKNIKTRKPISFARYWIVKPEIKIKNFLSNISASEIKLEP